LLRSLMAGRLSPIRVRKDDREGNSESNALSKRSASKGSPVAALAHGRPAATRRL
jgi:hypothetical protein